ncbi:hypothetical protein FKM82_030801 [Ascaphus truei]
MYKSGFLLEEDFAPISSTSWRLDLKNRHTPHCCRVCRCCLKCLATGKCLRSSSPFVFCNAFRIVERCMAIRSFSIRVVLPI